MAISLLVVLIGERKVRKIGSAGSRLLDGVVLVLAAVPIPNTQAQVVVRQLFIDLPSVPGLRQGRRIEGPNVYDHRRRICLLPNLDGLDLLRIERLNALVLAGAHLARMDYELVAIPETDRVALP